MRRYALAIIGMFAAGEAFAGRAHDLLAGQSEAAQRQAFTRIVRSAGDACPAVSRTLYLGDSAKGDVGFWTVRCGTGDFVVSVGNGGAMATTVLRCTVAQAMGLTCWTPFR